MYANLRISRRMAASLAAASAVGCTSTGCTRAKIGSDVKETGAWSRTIEMHAPAVDKTGLLKDAPKVEDSFLMPGPPWVVTRETKGEEIVVTCKRSVQPGETLKRDIVCKEKIDGKTVEVAVNECSVKETSPGVFTYREAIHWTGPNPKPAMDMDAAKILKTALPANLATDASVKRLSETMERSFTMTLMGPPDPLITTIMSQIMMNPDLAERNLAARMGDSLDRAFETEFGDKMTVEQRKAAVQKLVSAAFKSTSDKTNVDPTKGAAGANNITGTALTFAVKLPGKIVSTNGLIDKLTNEAYWGLYPEAASLGQDIVLTATCQTK